MKKRVFIMVFILLISLSGCGLVDQMFDETDREDFWFNELNTDITDAKMLGIARESDLETGKIESMGFGMSVFDEHANENTLVKETTSGDVVPLEFTDDEDEVIEEIPYSPIYIERKGNFSVSIMLKDVVPEEDKEGVAWFVPLMLESNDPLSFVFNTGISDMGYRMIFGDQSPTINIVLIHDDGTVYDMHELIHRVSDEKLQMYQTYAPDATLDEEGDLMFFPVDYVSGMSIYENSIQFNIARSEYSPSVTEAPLQKHTYYVNTYTHNTETKDCSDELFIVDKLEQFFTPTITDQFGHTLVLNDHDYELLKDGELFDISVPSTLKDSIYFLIDNEIYIFGSSYFDTETNFESLYLGKITSNGEFEVMYDLKSSEPVFSKYRTGFYGASEYYGNSYYFIEDYSFNQVSINEDRLYIQSALSNMLDMEALSLDLQTGDITTVDVMGQRHFTVGDVYFHLSDDAIYTYDFDSDTYSTLLDGVSFIDFYMEPYGYTKDYITLDTTNGDTYFVNIFSGELYKNELPDDGVFNEIEVNE